MRVPENGHEQLEHTADAGIRAFGGSLEEMFENAAEGMFRLLADTGALGEGIEVGLEVTAPALPESPSEPLIELRGLTKRFGARLALDALDLTVGRGEIFGLLGHNEIGRAHV